MAADAPNDASFRTQRILRHAPALVFDAFTRPDVLARWWGPSGFTNTFEVFEFRPGGQWNSSSSSRSRVRISRSRPRRGRE
jgi:uncharacterized protein YndB with AHSA1/START domain